MATAQSQAQMLWLQAFAACTIHKMVPFNPVDKKTSAVATMPDGQKIVTCKGAPQVALHICMHQGVACHW